MDLRDEIQLFLEKSVARIIADQKDDGSWDYGLHEFRKISSSVDTTAFELYALTKYFKSEQRFLDDAIRFLLKRGVSGFYGNDYIDCLQDSKTTALVGWALHKSLPHSNLRPVIETHLDFLEDFIEKSHKEDQNKNWYWVTPGEYPQNHFYATCFSTGFFAENGQSDLARRGLKKLFEYQEKGRWGDGNESQIIESSLVALSTILETNYRGKIFDATVRFLKTHRYPKPFRYPSWYIQWAQTLLRSDVPRNKVLDEQYLFTLRKLMSSQKDYLIIPPELPFFKRQLYPVGMAYHSTNQLIELREVL